MSMTPKEFAVEVESDPRTVRKFLRAEARENGTETPGKGSRWEIDSRKVRTLKKRFIAWNEARMQESDETPETE